MTDVGILGAGRLGQAMARVATRAGRSVAISNSREPSSLDSVASQLKVRATTAADAAKAAIVVIAVPWDSVPAAVLGIDWSGRIVIDATNDWAGDDLDGSTSSEIVSGLVAGARVVKAANTSAPKCSDQIRTRPAASVCSSSPATTSEAKSAVATLFQDAGFSTIDLGELATAARCNKSIIRSPVSTSSNCEELLAMRGRR